MVSQEDDGTKLLVWPSAVVFGPSDPSDDTVEVAALADDAELRVRSDNTKNVFLLLGTEPSRNWKKFTKEILGVAREAGVTGIVFLGAMLADVPHTRPISVVATSENAEVRAQLDIERSSYEGPVGILSVISTAAEAIGIPTVSIWASVPHYVHHAPSPKATLALIDKLEELIDVVIPRGNLVEESSTWETGIDALAGEDEDMAAYIQQLEQARDTVDSPEASGEAIAQEFERYLRKRGDGRDGRPDEPWRNRD
jgi:predicted ATP-grasp superfamily ATP-dependent carboligase